MYNHPNVSNGPDRKTVHGTELIGARPKVVLGCVGVIGLILAGIGTLVALNWDAVSKDLDEALLTQTERTQATLFRMGELMSISAELKAQYGTDPDVAYDTDTGDRILRISFNNYQLPGNVSTKAHAREIAAFAIGKTTKLEQIDAVTVRFHGSEPYSFRLGALMPAQPQAEPVEPDDSAAE